MEQDFAKRRTRTPLAEPDPQPQTSTSGLLFAGVVTGIVIGLFISLLIYMSGVLPPPPGLTAQLADAGQNQFPGSRAQTDTENGSSTQLTAELEREAARLQLEFYQELPNYEVVVDVTPVSVPQPRPVAVPQEPATTAAAEPTVSESPAQSSANETASAPATATAVTAAPISSGSFLLQAGAFQQHSTATAQANRLLALGLSATVRQENLPGRTLYLVQAGPYQTRDEMMQAERLLRSNNIETMRITLSQP